MNAKVIRSILRQDPYSRNLFQGFSTPDLPLPIKKTPAVIILNTDTSDGPGQHWCTVIFDGSDICEFFDPLGLSPEHYGLHKPIMKRAEGILFNTVAVQHPLSLTCGHHCIFYVLKRSRGLSHSDVLQLYDYDNLRKNDSMVFRFVAHNFGYDRAQIYTPAAMFF